MQNERGEGGPIRRAAVAGYFYPRETSSLKRFLRSVINPVAEKKKAVAVVAPHAGYVYSGAVAGAVFSSVEIPEQGIILGPAHRPIRPVFAMMATGAWDTPLGTVPVAAGLAASILAGCPAVVPEAAAHAGEHSLEVQLPFLRYLNSGFSFVPIAISHRASERDLEGLGRAIAAGVRSGGRETLIIASTDMSHYVSKAEARIQDFKAIDKILALDPHGLLDTVAANAISMCGYQPVAAALVAARELGATNAELVAYATSGDATGDEREVVGYAGLRIS
jgi:AmmeMemoRadiSam system protein B